MTTCELPLPHCSVACICTAFHTDRDEAVVVEADIPSSWWNQSDALTRHISWELANHNAYLSTIGAYAVDRTLYALH